MISPYCMDNAINHLAKCFANLGITTDKFPETFRTEERIIRMWVNEFFSNIDKEYEDFYLTENPKAGGIIGFHDLDYVSTCAHHFLPFSGTAHLLYIPNKYIVGASKPARLVDHYSKRPQLQELLCKNVIDKFYKVVMPIGVMVVMSGTHDCMRCRGVKKAFSSMTTSEVRGAFKDELELELKGYEIIKINQQRRM